MAKVGRNDPCPCGSGRKYKRCCGADPSIAAGAVATEPPLGGRGAMERAMAEVGRLLADREFGSIEEMNAYLERSLADPGRAAPPPRTPIERAQELIYQAWEARGGRRVRLARQALALWPDCADAYCLLAEETATTLQEARDLYAQALAAGERALGRERLDQGAGRFWGTLETRPYMRALVGLASCLWQEGRRREAIARWESMLRLNPNDNQGTRYALLAGLLEEGEDAAAEALLKRYPGDAAASWAYGRALLAYRRGGDSPAARRARTKALETNPHVPAYLTGTKPPRTMPEYVGLGDDSEAVVCAAEQMAAWQRTPGALAWLAGAAPNRGQVTSLRADAVYQLKVTLKGSRPPIWRRLLVRADTRLSRLHEILQVAMGWYDAHLHEFEVGPRRIGVPRRDSWVEVEDERRVRLSDVAPGERARFTYQYDFGDSWDHAIVVEKVLPPAEGADRPTCLAGRRAAPPEDVGGVWRYGVFLEAIRDPAHPEHDELLEWVGRAFDPEAFDLDAVNAALRRLR